MAVLIYSDFEKIYQNVTNADKQIVAKMGVQNLILFLTDEGRTMWEC